MTYFMMILKASFREARPYFVNTDIKPLQKYAEYGNPSGHVLLGYVVVSYLFDEFVYAHPCWTSCNVEEDHVCKGNKHGKYHWKKYAKQILHFFVVAMIFISRMYLGMHSFNQCLFSLTCGIWCHLMYNAWFKECIHNMITIAMAESHENEKEAHDAFDKKDHEEKDVDYYRESEWGFRDFLKQFAFHLLGIGLSYGLWYYSPGLKSKT